jgi:2-polyprenyl-3-methyl-5-hydroxy-6-metoxy-1,4-benzoquinol methylase
VKLVADKSIFERFFSEESLFDRLVEKQEQGIDVIIPLLNTNELWKKNLYSYYREIPIKRLLIGDGGCTDDSIKVAQGFPRLTVLDQFEYGSQGYCIRELIENVETEWFVYLHADVYLPQGWYDEMIRYQDRYDWYECKRHFVYMLYDTSDIQFDVERAYSGSQMGRKSAFSNITGQIDDDYIRRMEDIFFQQKIEENGFRYYKVPSTYHIHQVMNKQGEKEPKFASIDVKREEDEEWLLKIHNEMFRATVKYLSPEIDMNVKMVKDNMQYVLNNSPATEEELIEWIKETNPVWVNKLSEEHEKQKATPRYIKLATFPFRAARFLYRKLPITSQAQPGDIKKGRIIFDVGQVAGGGGSKNLPAFSSRIYHEIKTLKEMLGDLHVKRSLEIGCGYGRLTPWIAEYSEEFYAIEPEKKLYDIAKKLYPSFKFTEARADRLPFPDNYFGLIVTWTVLQHVLPEKFQDTINEILRVAAEDAVILVAEYTRDTHSPSSWGHSVEEYTKLLEPFVLVKQEQRKVENLIDYYVGEVMKFEKPGK